MLRSCSEDRAADLLLEAKKIAAGTDQHRSMEGFEEKMVEGQNKELLGEVAVVLATSICMYLPSVFLFFKVNEDRNGNSLPFLRGTPNT